MPVALQWAFFFSSLLPFCLLFFSSLLPFCLLFRFSAGGNCREKARCKREQSTFNLVICVTTDTGTAVCVCAMSIYITVIDARVVAFVASLFLF
jgi:hypothetical protein